MHTLTNFHFNKTRLRYILVVPFQPSIFPVDLIFLIVFSFSSLKLYEHTGIFFPLYFPPFLFFSTVWIFVLSSLFSSAFILEIGKWGSLHAAEAAFYV